MDGREKRTQRDYTLAFKLAVVDEVERGDLTYKEAQQRYGIQGRSTVLVWLRKHGRQDWSRLRSRRGFLVSQYSRPGHIKKDSQAIGHIQKHRPTLSAFGNYRAGLR